MSESAISVSIIVPVYNTGKYLRSCLDSLQRQTLRNLQFILIDDGSCDDSLAVCQSYAENDVRFQVISRRNGGIAAARMAGMERASGEYIGFMDHDDFCEPDMFEVLYREALSQSAEVSQCGFSFFYEDSRTVVPACVSEDRIVEAFLRRSHGAFDLQLCRFIRPMIWRRIYRRDFLQTHRISFDVALTAGQDDMHFILKVWTLCERLAIVPRRLYYWRRHSAQYSAIDDERIFNQCVGWDALRAFAERNRRPEALAAIAFAQSDFLPRVLENIAPRLIPEFCRRCGQNWNAQSERQLRKNGRELWTLPEVPLKIKILESLSSRLIAAAYRKIHQGRLFPALRLLGFRNCIAGGDVLRTYGLAPWRLLRAVREKSRIPELLRAFPDAEDALK